MSTQRRVNAYNSTSSGRKSALSHQDTNVISIELNKAETSEDFSGIMGPAKKAVLKYSSKDNHISHSIGPDTSSFRASIETKDLIKEPSNLELSNSELIGEALKHWIEFAKTISRIGQNGAKVFAQINDNKATVHLLISTPDLLEN